MPTLTNTGEVIDDQWPISQDPHTDALEPYLVPLERWRSGHPGLLLPVDAEPQPEFAAAKRIGIEFPAFNDGRGLSLAVLLRTRSGFSGELRALGDIQPDMLHYLRRCGFDSFELADPGRARTATATLAPHDAYYQASVIDPEPKFRRG